MSEARLRQAELQVRPRPTAQGSVPSLLETGTIPTALRAEAVGGIRAAVGQELSRRARFDGKDLAGPLEQGQETIGIVILRRILAYGQKICRLRALLDGVTDTRKRPRIATSVVIRGALVMMRKTKVVLLVRLLMQ